MSFFKTLWQSVNYPTNTLLQFKNEPKIINSFVIVIFSAVISGIVIPVFEYIVNKNVYNITVNPLNMMFIVMFCLIYYIAACVIFKFLSIVFQKEVSFRQILATWGFSFLPTSICILIANASEILFYSFLNNAFLAYLVSTFLIMILIWKVILYFIEMNVVLNLAGFELFLATLIIAVLYLVLIFINFSIGLIVPPL
jgi:hypothetical protein